MVTLNGSTPSHQDGEQNHAHYGAEGGEAILGGHGGRESAEEGQCLEGEGAGQHQLALRPILLEQADRQHTEDDRPEWQRLCEGEEHDQDARQE